MNLRNLRKPSEMEENVTLITVYEDEDGQIHERVYSVPVQLKEYVDSLIAENFDLDMEAAYWKRMMGFHITKGVGAN